MRDDEDFEALWRAHHRRVYAYALRRTDPAAAQDVTSEAFLVAWRRRSEMPTDALPWLIGVARHLLANQARAGRRRVALAEALAAQARLTLPSDPPDLGLYAALAGLNETDREVLLLTAWDGLSGAQAARVLGCSPATVWVRASRARSRLRQELNPAHHPISEVPAR